LSEERILGDQEEYLCDKPLGSELSKSIRRKECMGIQGLHKAKLKRNNVSKKHYRDLEKPIS
jgi:hypothetical protein